MSTIVVLRRINLFRVIYYVYYSYLHILLFCRLPMLLQVCLINTRSFINIIDYHYNMK